MLKGRYYAHLVLNKGSYTSSCVLLNLLNEFKKRDTMQGYAKIFYCFSATSLLINSIIQEHKCKI